MARDRNEIKKELPELEAMLIDFLFDCGVGAKHINCKKVLEYAPKIQELCDRLTNERKKVLEQLSEIPNDLEEAAEEYVCSWLKKGNEEVRELFPEAAHDAFISGAKWQADHTPLPEDTVIFNKGIEEGKRLMMEEAVEGEVYLYHSYNRDATAILVDIPKEKLGDKVRIIIVKEKKNGQSD